jgi:hypothetical protein
VREELAARFGPWDWPALWHPTRADPSELDRRSDPERGGGSPLDGSDATSLPTRSSSQTTFRKRFRGLLYSAWRLAQEAPSAAAPSSEAS